MRTFRSLRHRNYALYFSGQLVSFTGSWMQNAALMWLVYDVTSDPFWPPVLLVAAVGPTLLLGPVGGALADRCAKKWLIFATQLLFLVGAVTMVTTLLYDVPNPNLLLAIQLFCGIVQGIDLPARLSFVPELVPKEDLINAVGLNSLTFNVARALGPALAGSIFYLSPGGTVRGGAITCIIVNALSYAAVLIALLKINVGNRAPPRSKSPTHFWDGLRFLLAKPGLAGLIVLTGVLSIFGWPLLSLLPAYAKSVLGRSETTYSFLVSAVGAGALIGSLTTATFGTPARRERFLVSGALASFCALFGIHETTTLQPAIAFCMLFGFGLILFLSIGQSTLQLDSPDASRGRVMAFWAMTLSGSSIPGHLLAGKAAQLYPLADVLSAMLLGVAAAVAGLVALVLSGHLRSRSTA